MKAEHINTLPPRDRHEIVGEAMALVAGATIPRPNPLAVDLTRADTSLAGVSNALGIDIRAAVSSPDLASAISEALRHLSLEARKTRDLSHRRICRMINLPNFKQQAVPWPQPVTLTEVPEGQEVPILAPGVTWTATAAIKSYAGMIPFTRQSITNADWGLLATIAEELLDAAYRCERESIFALLADNANLDDGTPWFDSSRNNVSSVTGAPSVLALEAAISALRLMGDNGVALGLKPAFCVVPATQEIGTEILLEAGARVVFSADRPTLADPGLTSDWFVLPDPTVRSVIGLAHLPNGTEPVVDLRPKFTSDAVYIRCRHSFGAAPLSPFAVRVSIA